MLCNTITYVQCRNGTLLSRFVATEMSDGNRFAHIAKRQCCFPNVRQHWAESIFEENTLSLIKEGKFPQKISVEDNSLFALSTRSQS